MEITHYIEEAEGCASDAQDQIQYVIDALSEISSMAYDVAEQKQLLESYADDTETVHALGFDSISDMIRAFEGAGDFRDQIDESLSSLGLPKTDEGLKKMAKAASIWLQLEPQIKSIAGLRDGLTIRLNKTVPAFQSPDKEVN